MTATRRNELLRAYRNASIAATLREIKDAESPLDLLETPYEEFGMYTVKGWLLTTIGEEAFNDMRQSVDSYDHEQSQFDSSEIDPDEWDNHPRNPVALIVAACQKAKKTVIFATTYDSDGRELMEYIGLDLYIDNPEAECQDRGYMHSYCRCSLSASQYRKLMRLVESGKNDPTCQIPFEVRDWANDSGCRIYEF